MKLYHATTEKKAKLYRHTGAILAPVRGFTTLQAAMAWAEYCLAHRTVDATDQVGEKVRGACHGVAP